jgi:hypothetical protein
MNKIILHPQIGINIEGVGQINFGDSKEKVLQILGPQDEVNAVFRMCYAKLGCFIDFSKTDNTFSAVEFWNDHSDNVGEVFIYDTEVLQSEALPIKTMLQEKNNNEAPNDGWYVNIDVIYSGGNQKTMLAYIEELKKECAFEGFAKEQTLLDLEKAKYFSSFGIGYKGYCKDGLAELDAILNPKQ